MATLCWYWLKLNQRLQKVWWKFMKLEQSGYKMDEYGWKWIASKLKKVKIIRSKKGSGHSRPGSYYVKGWPQMTASYDKLWQMAQDLPTW